MARLYDTQDDVTVTTDDEEIELALLAGEFDGPLMWDNDPVSDEEKSEFANVAKGAFSSVLKDDNPWKPYEGPGGGEGWQHVETGEIRYQEDQPEPGEGGEDWDEAPDTYQPMVDGEFDPLDPPPNGYDLGWGAPPEQWGSVPEYATVEVFTEGGGYEEGQVRTSFVGDDEQYVVVLTEDGDKVRLHSHPETGDDGAITAVQTNEWGESWEPVDWEDGGDVPLDFTSKSQVIIDEEKHDLQRVDVPSATLVTEDGEWHEFRDVDGFRAKDPALEEVPSADEVEGVDEWHTDIPDTEKMEYGDIVAFDGVFGDVEHGRINGFGNNGGVRVDRMSRGGTATPPPDNIKAYADVGENPLAEYDHESSFADVEAGDYVEVASIQWGEASTTEGEVVSVQDGSMELLKPNGDVASRSLEDRGEYIKLTDHDEDYDPYENSPANGMQMEPSEVAVNVTSDVDWDDHGDHEYQLSEEQAGVIRDGLEEHFPDPYVERFYSSVSSWKGSSSGRKAQQHERSFKQALDIESPYRSAGRADEEPTDYQEQIAAVASELSREYWDEVHDGHRMIHRGISDPALDNLVDDWLETPDADKVELSHLAMNNYSGDIAIANSFGDNSAVITNSVRSDEVAIATDALFNVGGGHAREEEVGVIGDDQHVTMGDVQFMDGGGFSMDTDFDSMSDHQVEVFADYLRDYYYTRATGEHDLGGFNERQYETLVEFAEEAATRDLGDANSNLVENVKDDAEELHGVGPGVPDGETDAAGVEVGEPYKARNPQGVGSIAGPVVDVDGNTVTIEDDYGIEYDIHVSNLIEQL